MEDSTLPPALPSSTTTVLDAVARGVTVLTPTRRAANALARTVDAAALLQGNRSWRAPAILPWSAWTAAQWSRAIVGGVTTDVLLNSTQERALWTRIILQSGTDAPSSAGSQADLCMGALRLLGAFGANSEFAGNWPGEAYTADMETFRRWYLRFVDLCRQQQYLSFACVEAELAGLYTRAQLTGDGEYLLYGFATLTPARQQMIDALRRRGAIVTESHPSPANASNPLLLQYANADAELRACAQWARWRLQLSPMQTAAIVVPDLAEVRSEVERELRLAVAPESANVLGAVPVPYEFSCGLPLRSLQLVQHAVLLLRWCVGSLPLDEAGVLLRSPHLSLAGTPEDGAALDEGVVRANAGLRKQVSLSRAAVLLRSYPATIALQNLEGEAERLRRARQQTVAYFADRIPVLLGMAGWPGPNALNDEERQAVDHWQRVLDDVASLDLLSNDVSWRDVVGYVVSGVARAVFTPEPRARPLQVLTVAEAEGNAADALWFLHAEADTWPHRPAPHALLPLGLQRRFGMPGISRANDEALAAAQLGNLLHSVAGETRLSWSADATSGSTTASPIIAQQVFSLGGSSGVATDADSPPKAEALLETFFDTNPLPPLPEGEVYGGVSVLTAQAQCGFRAWAEKRVFAAPLELEEDGLSPAERGDQVHAVLEKFWQRTGSQAALRSKKVTVGTDGQSERDTLLLACIAEVCSTSAPQSWDAAYLAVQQQRLFRLLAAWLDYEETRPPFRVVQLERGVQDVPVGPLRLRMRVDRVDTVLAGNDDRAQALGTVLIDYKTGRSSRNDWAGERPSQPQLPAYAVAAAAAAGVAQVDGIAFASIRAGSENLFLDGVAQPGLLPSRKRAEAQPFREHAAEWQASVNALAEAFAAGDASVDPKLYPQTCKTCTQRILCRLDVATLLQTEPDAVDDSLAEAE